jgi:hypothetical protein
LSVRHRATIRAMMPMRLHDARARKDRGHGDDSGWTTSACATPSAVEGLFAWQDWATLLGKRSSRTPGRATPDQVHAARASVAARCVGGRCLSQTTPAFRLGQLSPCRWGADPGQHRLRPWRCGVGSHACSPETPGAGCAWPNARSAQVCGAEVGTWRRDVEGKTSPPVPSSTRVLQRCGENSGVTTPPPPSPWAV